MGPVKNAAAGLFPLRRFLLQVGAQVDVGYWGRGWARRVLLGLLGAHTFEQEGAHELLTVNVPGGRGRGDGARGGADADSFGLGGRLILDLLHEQLNALATDPLQASGLPSQPATRTWPGTEMPLSVSAEITPEANTSVRPMTKSGRSSAGRSAIWVPML